MMAAASTKMKIILVTFIVTFGVSVALESGNVFKPTPLEPGPWVQMSQGAIWPRPAQQVSWPHFMMLDSKTFNFQVCYTFLKTRRANIDG